MLTIRENFLETIHGGHPDRFVNCYEYLGLVMGSPFGKRNPNPKYGEHNIVNAWGVTKSWPEGTPGPFPVHTEDKIVVKDIEEWQKYVKVPNVVYDAEEWEPFIAAAEKIDRKQQFVTGYFAPGVFEQDYAAEFCKYVHPEAMFHHDDWGSQISTFISPEMFREFYKPAYEKIYGYYKSHGVQLIVHHSDSYAATLVPDMIDMGIDVWQGVMNTNNIPELIKEYGGKISFMGGIDSATVDFPGWTREIVREQVRKACSACGTLYFIPCASQGLPMSTYPGVQDAIAEEIDLYSKEVFK